MVRITADNVEMIYREYEALCTVYCSCNIVFVYARVMDYDTDSENSLFLSVTIEATATYHMERFSGLDCSDIIFKVELGGQFSICLFWK